MIPGMVIQAIGNKVGDQGTGDLTAYWIGGTNGDKWLIVTPAQVIRRTGTARH